MEISRIPAPDALHAVRAASAETVEGPAQVAPPEAHPVHPDARLDGGAPSALVQAFARPDRSQPAASRAGDGALAAPALAGSEFSLPADQLLNAAVIGLQVEPAFAWQLQRRGFDAELQPLPEPPDDSPGQAVGGWAPALSRALREALRRQPAAQALLAAAEQWSLGRCVVLACPRGADPAGPAWAFVLWPRHGSLPGAPLALSGLRVEARLRWSRLPPTVEWCHARVMKQQHPRQGRQLIALEACGTAAVACEVQLGPLPLRTPRWRHACVRIDAVHPFWNALGPQWSVTVVVGSRPLAGIDGPGSREAAPCQA